MKNRFLIFMFAWILLWSPGMVKGQALTASYEYSTSSYAGFNHLSGFNVGARMLLGRHSAINVDFSYGMNKKAYVDTFFADYNGKSYIRRISPENTLYQFTVSYSYDLLKAKRWSLFLGSQLSLGYYYLNEHFIQNEIGQSQFDTLHYEFWDGKNRLSLGFSLSLEYSLSNRIALFGASSPMVVFYTRSLMVGMPKPSRILMANYKLGMVYYLIPKYKDEQIREIQL